MDEKQKEQYKKIIAILNDLSVESYREECRRADNLFKKSHALMGYNMAMVVFINAIISMYIKACNANIVRMDRVWIYLYIIILVAFLISIIMCITSQYPRKRKGLPDGEQAVRRTHPKFDQNNVEIEEEASYGTDIIKYYSGISGSLNTTYEGVAKHLMVAYSMFLAGIIILTVAMCLFMYAQL